MRQSDDGIYDQNIAANSCSATLCKQPSTNSAGANAAPTGLVLMGSVLVLLYAAACVY
jgi:hypothetical protein